MHLQNLEKRSLKSNSHGHPAFLKRPLSLTLRLMPLALAALLLAISLTSCSRPDGRLAERAHQLLNEGKLQQAQESLQDGFRQFPQSVALRQERLRLNLLAGQPELAAAEAQQILQTQPSAQPYRL
ncbi:MAG: hypothetical protein EBS60_02005, partial [Verrucomicrobia bacterium]|nr:hypothetical protein [Verrucomicrobiota bacterium]